MEKSKLVTEYTQRLEVLQNIIDAIHSFERLKKVYQDSIDNEFYRSFPNLLLSYKHKVEIYNMCIDRMKYRFNKEVSYLEKL